MKKFLPILFLLTTTISALAQNDLVHSTTSYVDDYANIIDASHRASIDVKIRAIKVKSTAEISVVTVSSLNGRDIEGFTLDLARRWGVGGKSNNGLMILVAPNDHKWRIEVGSGLEGTLTDMGTSNDADAILKPAFRAGNFGDGIEALVDKFGSELDPEQKAIAAAEQAKQEAISKKQTQTFFTYLLYIVFIIVVITAIVITCLHIVAKKNKKKIEFEAAKSRFLKQLTEVRKLYISAETASGKTDSGSVSKLELQRISNLVKSYNAEIPIYKSAAEYSAAESEITKLITLVKDDLDQIISDVSTIYGTKVFLNDEYLSLVRNTQISLGNSSITYDKLKESHLDLFPPPNIFTNTLMSQWKDITVQLANTEKLLNSAISNGNVLEVKRFKAQLMDLLSKASAKKSPYDYAINLVQTKISYIESGAMKMTNLVDQYLTNANHTYVSPQSKDQFQKSVPIIRDKIARLGDTTLSLLIRFAIYAEVLNLLDNSYSGIKTEIDTHNIKEAEIKRQQDEIIRQQQEVERKKREEEERRRKKQRDEEEEEAARIRRQNDSYMSSSMMSSSGSSNSSDSSSSFGGGSFGGGGSSGTW